MRHILRLLESYILEQELGNKEILLHRQVVLAAVKTVEAGQGTRG